MKTIKCNFTTQSLHDNPKMREILRVGGNTAKFWALYGESHLTFEGFKGMCLRLKDSPPKSVYELSSLAWNAMPYINPAHKVNDWATQHWDYFNPSTRRKIKLEFAEGSHIKSIVY